MTTREIDVLNKLDQSIKNLELDIRKINSARKDDAGVTSVYVNHVKLDAFKQIPGLEGNLMDIVEDSYKNQLNDLKKRLDQLVLCTHVKSKGPDYLPINIV